MAIINNRAALIPKQGRTAIVMNIESDIAPEPEKSIYEDLFANGEQGWDYDINDLNTLFLDVDGVVNATEVGQAIARVNDKSGNGNHLFQSNALLRPILMFNENTGAYFLRFSDHALATLSSVNFSGSSTITGFATIWKRSDAKTGYVFETSAIIDSNNGSINLAAPAWGGTQKFSSDIGYGVGGVTYKRAFTENTRFNAPIFAVVTSRYTKTATNFDIKLDVNSELVASVSGTQASAVLFGSHILHVGRRNSVTAPFDGDIYRLTCVGRAVTSEEKITIEALLSDLII